MSVSSAAGTSSPLDQRASRAQRVAAIATGAGLAGAAALVTVFDPSAADSRFPACAFHAATGLWCPGCGLTRGTHHLFRGDVAASLSSNAFTPVVLVAIVGVWLAWTLGAFGRPVRTSVGLPRWTGIAAVVLVVAFSVLRNLSGTPFAALAP